MLNCLNFGKEVIIKAEVQPRDTDTLYSCSPIQLNLTLLSKLSAFIVCKINKLFSYFTQGFGNVILIMSECLKIPALVS